MLSVTLMVARNAHHATEGQEGDSGQYRQVLRWPMAGKVVRKPAPSTFSGLDIVVSPAPNRPQRRYERPDAHLGMVRIGVTVGFEEVVRSHGGNPDRVVEASGLLPAISGRGSSQITLGAFSSFLRAAADEVNLQTFSMEFGRAFDVRNLGAIGYLFDFAPDLGTALKDFCAYFDLVQDNTEIGIEAHGDLARIVYSVRGGRPEHKAPDAEFSIAMLAAALDAGQDCGPEVFRLDLEHRPSWQLEAAPLWLRRDIQPGSARNAVLVPRQSLERPGRASDRYLYELVVARVVEEYRNLNSHRNLVGAVIEELTRALNSGDIAGAAASGMADKLGMSARTLHRRLAAYGSTFRELRNTVVLDRGKSLLAETDHSVTEIAFRLGFSETSAFSRAFRLLTGQTPVEFRQSKARLSRRH